MESKKIISALLAANFNFYLLIRVAGNKKIGIWVARVIWKYPELRKIRFSASISYSGKPVNPKAIKMIY